MLTTWRTMLCLLAQQLKRPSAYTHTRRQSFEGTVPTSLHIWIQFYFNVSRPVDKICLEYIFFPHCDKYFQVLFEKTDCIFYSWQETLDLLTSCDVTTQTWTNTCSVKGFEIPLIARVGRQKKFLSNALSHVFLILMLVILIHVHTLFNCSVDTLNANWWMILHFIELNVNPNFTNPQVTKQCLQLFY